MPLQPIEIPTPLRIDGGMPLQPIEMPNCSTLTSMILDLAAVMVQRADAPRGDTLAARMLMRIALEIASLDAEVERRC